MIKITNVETYGWEAAFRGMRNPLNSWEKSDSEFDEWDKSDFFIGQEDAVLALKLVKGGPVHAKFRRMIIVTCDILAPLYWWKEFDTYKVGTVANSCSTMHTIHKKEFELSDFSHEHLFNGSESETETLIQIKEYSSLGVFHTAYGILDILCDALNHFRELYLQTKDKKYWWQMIQLLPASYNQKRTVQMNYEVLAGIYESRKDHKLDEWQVFCRMIERLPYPEFIIGEKK